jgi:hypothetical protein
LGTIYVDYYYRQCFMLPITSPTGATRMANRATQKSTALKLKRFQITADALPGAIFFSLADLRDGCHDALMERRAFNEYRTDGVEETLFDRLRGLGWEYADIAAVARGAEMVTSYGKPTA